MFITYCSIFIVILSTVSFASHTSILTIIYIRTTIWILLILQVSTRLIFVHMCDSVRARTYTHTRTSTHKLHPVLACARRARTHTHNNYTSTHQHTNHTHIHIHTHTQTIHTYTYTHTHTQRMFESPVCHACSTTMVHNDTPQFTLHHTARHSTRHSTTQQVEHQDWSTCVIQGGVES